MKNSVVYNHSLLKTDGVAMPRSGYSKPALKRYRLSDELHA